MKAPATTAGRTRGRSPGGTRARPSGPGADTVHPAPAGISPDRRSQGNALLARFAQHPDVARRLRGLNHALAAYGAGGDEAGQSAALELLALACRELGLYGRAIRLALQTLALCRREGDAAREVTMHSILVG